MREEKIKNMIQKELKRYFHVMSRQEILEAITNYKSVKDKNKRAKRMLARDPPPTDYNREVIHKFDTRQKAMKAITKKVQDEVIKRFGIEKEWKINETNFQVDLFDGNERVCYEIALGNGTEIWKDILKALIVKARKLVIFGRSYPNPWGMVGYNYLRRHWRAMKNRIELEVELIEFVSEKTYS